MSVKSKGSAKVTAKIAAKATARVTAQNEFFTVIDDLLPADTRARLWNYRQVQLLNSVSALGIQGHWLLEDSGVLRGPTVGWGHTWDAQYPSGVPVVDVMK